MTANQYRRLQQPLKEEEKYLILDPQNAEYLKDLMDKYYSINQIPQLIADAGSEELKKQYRGYVGMRRIISIEYPPINVFIDNNLIPFLIGNIQSNQQLHLQTLRIFTFIASGTDAQSSHLTDKETIEFLISSLASENDRISLQAIWAVANLLGDSNKNRQVCMDAGAVQVFLAQLDLSIKIGNTQKYSSIVWALSNICRGKPLQPYQKIQSILLAIVHCFQELIITNEQMMQEVIWSINNYKKIPQILMLLVELKSIQKLILYAQEKVVNISFPALNIIIFMLKEDKDIGQLFINCGLLDSLQKSINSSGNIRNLCVMVVLQLTEDISLRKAIVEHSSLLYNLLSVSDIDYFETINRIKFILENLLKLEDQDLLVMAFDRQKVIPLILKQLNQCDQLHDYFLDILYSIMISGFKLAPNPNPHILKLQQSLEQLHPSLISKLECHITDQPTLSLLFQLTSLLP